MISLTHRHFLFCEIGNTVLLVGMESWLSEQV